jgi:hypothetical protein
LSALTVVLWYLQFMHRIRQTLRWNPFQRFAARRLANVKTIQTGPQCLRFLPFSFIITLISHKSPGNCGVVTWPKEQKMIPLLGLQAQFLRTAEISLVPKLVHPYVCMYVCTHACMSVYMYACMNASMNIRRDFLKITNTELALTCAMYCILNSFYSNAQLERVHVFVTSSNPWCVQHRPVKVRASLISRTVGYNQTKQVAKDLHLIILSLRCLSTQRDRYLSRYWKLSRKFTEFHHWEDASFL